MNNHRQCLSHQMDIAGQLRRGSCDAFNKYLLAACLVLALLIGCESEAPVKPSATSSAPSLALGGTAEGLPVSTFRTDDWSGATHPDLIAKTDSAIDFDLSKKSHTFKGFGAQIWAYGSDENYHNLLKYRQKVLSDLNIKYVRIENYREFAKWKDVADTRAMTDELGIKWVYMIWSGPNQYEDSKRLLTDVSGFATWWKDHVVELYENNIPVEYIELMNEPDSDGQWSTGITPIQFNKLVKDLRKKLDDAGLGNVGIVGAGPANMWKFPNYAKALDEKGVEALAIFSTHAWGTDGAWMGHQGLGPGQFTYKTTVDNFIKPCNENSPTKPKFVTEYSTHQTKYGDITYPHGDKYGKWDPDKVVPNYSVTDSMGYAVRTFTNTLALLNAGAEAPFVWQANDEPTESSPPGYNRSGKRKAWGLIDLEGREKPVYGALKTIYPNIPIGAQVLIAPDQTAKTLYAGAFVTDDKVIIGISNESSAETTSVINLSNAGSLKFNQALAFETVFRGDPAKGEPDKGKEIKKQLTLKDKGPDKYAIDITLPPLSTLTIILDKDTVNALKRSSTSALVRVSPSDAEVLYFGTWIQTPNQTVPDSRRSNSPFTACEIAFRESQVRWFGSRGPDHGIVDVYLDGQLMEKIDTYAPNEQARQMLFEAKGLKGDRIHTLRITVLPKRNPKSTNWVQSIDGFEVGSVVDFPRHMHAIAMDELKTITSGTKPYLKPEDWKPVAYSAKAPETSVKLNDGVLHTAFERNISYILESAEKPCNSFWVWGLPASSEGRMLGAAAHSLRWEEREDLRAIVDYIVGTIEARQAEDGYCLPYNRLFMRAQKESFLDERRNYDRVNLTRGMVAAGLAGNKDALPVMRRFYDWLNAEEGIYSSLLAGPHDGSGNNCNNGHEGGLLMYFSDVGKPEDLISVERYFVQDFFIDQMRLAEPLALSYYGLSKPHSYVLLAFKAWLDHYRATGADKYLEASLGAWEVVNRYYEHIGGTIAICEEQHEGLYPPQSYLLTKHTGETCGSVFWADINHRLLQLFPDKEAYAAEIEKSIFNVILAAQDEKGYIRYHNNLDGKKDTPKRINTCCEVMGTPFIARLPQYIYSVDDDGLWVNLFAASQIGWKQNGKDVTVNMNTQFPYNGKVGLSIATPSETTMTLRVRIPSWISKSVTVTVNGKEAAKGEPGSFVSLARNFKDGDSVDMMLPMELKTTQYTGIDQSPRQWWDLRPVKHRNKYALTYGPILMALVGSKDVQLDMSSEELPAALSPDGDKPLHFAIRGRDDCHYEPYWALANEPMTCFPKFK